MLKHSFLLMFFIITGITHVKAQEKFLEIELAPQLFNGSSVKNYVAHVTTLEGGVFELPVKRKKVNFFLPSGERYTIAIEKEGFHPSYYTIDLRNIPEELDRDNKHSLKLKPYLHPQVSERPIPHVKYHFSDKYKKVVFMPSEID